MTITMKSQIMINVLSPTIRSHLPANQITKMKPDSSPMITTSTISDRYILKDLQSIEKKSGWRMQTNQNSDELKSKKKEGPKGTSPRERRAKKKVQRRNMWRRLVKVEEKVGAKTKKYQTILWKGKECSIERERAIPLRKEGAKVSKRATKATLISQRSVTITSIKAGTRIRTKSSKRENTNDDKCKLSLWLVLWSEVKLVRIRVSGVTTMIVIWIDHLEHGSVIRVVESMVLVMS